MQESDLHAHGPPDDEYRAEDGQRQSDGLGLTELCEHYRAPDSAACIAPS